MLGTGVFRGWGQQCAPRHHRTNHSIKGRSLFHKLIKIDPSLPDLFKKVTVSHLWESRHSELTECKDTALWWVT